jgi:signal transduction histidine kinase
VPLVVGGAVTGVVAVALTRPSTEPDEWLLSALADQAAVALQNAQIGGAVRVDLEERLRLSEGATNAKDRALSTLAHDIRSPLGAIEGYCAILEDGLCGPVNDKQRDALGRVRMSGRHLLSLLDNVMDMARLTAGLVSVHSDPVRMREVARDAVDILIPASYAKQQQLVLESGTDVTVNADASRLRQVLVNLVGNSVKFTGPGGLITVSTRAIVLGGREWGEIRVTDTGPGIAKSDREAIFEPYFRSEGTAAIPGVGLGLAISSALVVQMGGRLEVESEVGVGSSFTIRLPLVTQSSFR